MLNIPNEIQFWFEFMTYCTVGYFSNVSELGQIFKTFGASSNTTEECAFQTVSTGGQDNRSI